MRLIYEGTKSSFGRVEVLYGGLWGTVCDDRWDLDDANVVCRQLGYPDAVSAPRDSLFGQGSGEALLKDVQCTGKEDYLSQCSNSGWGKRDCWHRDVASAVCSKPGNGTVAQLAVVLECLSQYRIPNINISYGLQDI